MSDGFRTALQVHFQRMVKPRLATGFGDLDLLMGGGVELGHFYLIYGDGESGVDLLLHRMLVNSLLPRERGGFGGRSLYVNCGNYKRERTTLDIELLAGLLKSVGLDPALAMREIYAVCAFSEDQEEKIVDEVCRLMEGDRDIKLVVVHHIAKLFTDSKLGGPAPSIPRLQRVLGTIFQACVRNEVALVATCRPNGSPRGRVPWPEGGRYLCHTANVIVHLQRIRRTPSVRASLLKHPSLPERKVTLVLGGESMGRITIPFRTRLQEQLDELKRDLSPVLMDYHKVDAFESLGKVWTSEQGAMGYVNVPTVLDAMLLVGEIDNRKLIMELAERLAQIEAKIDKLQKG